MLKCYYVGWIHDYNKKKALGMMNALKKQEYDIFLTHINNNLFDVGPCDLLFGELKTINLDFKNFKNVFVWSLMDLDRLIQVAEAHPDTNFIIGSKSYVHEPLIVEKHCSLYGNIYMKDYEPERINLEDYIRILSNSKKINDNIYQILNNLYYYFAPLSLSEDEPIQKEKIYDVCYFGTLENRPNIKKFFENNKHKINCIGSFNIDGITDPENVINYYQKSKLVIHEYVNPPILEHPVRLGEAPRQGCQYIGLSTIDLSSTYNPLVPNHKLVSSYDEFENKILNELNSFTPNYQTLNTYDDCVNTILNIFKGKYK